ncbi:MAG: IPTL-CTERM sorting domain-containing protein [Betaproteobacteria bacterium]
MPIPTSIPTLNEWGIIILVTMISVAALVQFRRTRRK